MPTLNDSSRVQKNNKAAPGIAATISSMTAFARGEGTADTSRWVWEVKSVNNRGLDLRFRLPPGFDEIEGAIRRRIAQKVSRGAVSVCLIFERSEGEAALRINEDLLEEVLSLSLSISERTGAAAMTTGELLAVKGVIVPPEKFRLEEGHSRLKQPLLESFETTLDLHLKERAREGAALGRVISHQLRQISQCTSEARSAAGSLPSYVQTRLEAVLKELQADTVEPERVAQEVAMIAVKADIQEEIDRLMVHCAAAEGLIENGGVIGRPFDFLTQELNREANTLCSKAQTQNLKEIGLELKGLIDQMREQIQNIE